MNPLHTASLNYLAKEVAQLAKDKGWDYSSHTEDENLERICNNLHDEVSELHQAWRENKLREPCDKAAMMQGAGLPALTYLEEELADIIIRALNDSQTFGIDIGLAVCAKHEFNKTRPHRHGGKKS